MNVDFLKSQPVSIILHEEVFTRARYENQQQLG